MNTDKFTYLIYKKHVDGLDQAESELLKGWLQASEKHRSIEQSILLSMGELEDYQPKFKVNALEDYQALKEKLNVAETITSNKSIKLNYWKWIGSAAAITLLIFGSFWVFQTDSASLLSYQTQEGETHLVVLADGSKVWLNENSSLDYPKTFNKSRAVSLEGEAFFNIVKLEGSAFEIETTHSTVKVLGTSFNVRAYPSENNTQVAVKTGTVSFNSKLNTSKAILKASQAASLNHDLKKMEPFIFENSNAMAWQDQMLHFKAVPFNAVIDRLERHFKIKITLLNDELKECLFSMTLQKADLPKILNNLKHLFGVEIDQVKEGIYTIAGGKCR